MLSGLFFKLPVLEFDVLNLFVISNISEIDQDDMAKFKDWLTDEERLQATRSHDERVYVVSRAAARFLAAFYLGKEVDEVSLAYSDSGQPSIPGNRLINMSIAVDVDTIVLGMCLSAASSLYIQPRHVSSDFDKNTIPTSFRKPFKHSENKKQLAYQLSGLLTCLAISERANRAKLDVESGLSREGTLTLQVRTTDNNVHTFQVILEDIQLSVAVLTDEEQFTIACHQFYPEDSSEEIEVTHMLS